MTDSAPPSPPAILYARGIRLVEGAPAIDTVVREGEIIGLAGLEGHGQQRFLQILCGLHPPAEGVVEAVQPDGKTLRITSLHKAAKAGIAYLPRERKTEGILPVLSVLDNFAIATLPAFSRFGILQRGAQRRELAEFRDRLSMVFASPNAPITSLSGGNQQKVLLARWLAASPRVMLLNDPTRGVDMATKLKLYEVFREAAEQEQRALVLLSSEIEELVLLCDRTLIFRDGSVFAELERANTSRSSILAAMFGRTDGN
jgi:ribose transport system ATP-binding protein